jgi:hypothetical protein
MASYGIMIHNQLHENWSNGSRVEEMADILPISYARFPSSQKKIRLWNAAKKNSNLNVRQMFI